MSNNPRPNFDEQLASDLLDVIHRCLETPRAIDLVVTRHAPLPDCVKSTGTWKVDQKQLKNFHTVVHFLTCALFGVDDDGDRAVQHTLLDRSRYDSSAEIVHIPRVPYDGKDRAKKLLKALEAAQTNAAAASGRVNDLLRLYIMEARDEDE